MKSFRLIFAFFLFLTLQPEAAAQDSIKPYFFIQVTDIQFGMYSKNKDFMKETELYTKIVEAINRLDPDFVVFTGDLVNDKDHRNQVDEFKRLTAKIEDQIPIYYSPGNHDIGQAPVQGDIDKFISDYGHDRFSIKHKGSLFIGLNSCLIKSKTPDLENIQFNWLNQQLSDGKEAKHSVLFTHYPFFRKWYRERETYSNLPKDMRKKYLKLFEKKGVDAVFAGHRHKNSSAKFRGIDIITTSASGKPFGKAASGLRVIKVFRDKIESVYYSIEKIPETISFSGN